MKFHINFNITRNNNKYIEQPDIKENINKDNNNLYYLPEFNIRSNILNEYNIIHLWEKLPKEFKSNKASIIFSNKENKNIKDIINIFNKENQDIKFLFLIKTNMNEIFGFSFLGNINYTNEQFIKVNKGFLLSIEPEIKIYNISPYCSEILYVDNDNILIGKDGKQPLALKISGDLTMGETHSGDC